MSPGLKGENTTRTDEECKYIRAGTSPDFLGSTCYTYQPRSANKGTSAPLLDSPEPPARESCHNLKRYCHESSHIEIVGRSAVHKSAHSLIRHLFYASELVAFSCSRNPAPYAVVAFSLSSIYSPARIGFHFDTSPSCKQVGNVSTTVS